MMQILCEKARNKRPTSFSHAIWEPYTPMVYHPMNWNCKFASFRDNPQRRQIGKLKQCGIYKQALVHEYYRRGGYKKFLLTFSWKRQTSALVHVQRNKEVVECCGSLPRHGKGEIVVQDVGVFARIRTMRSHEEFISFVSFQASCYP